MDILDIFPYANYVFHYISSADLKNDGDVMLQETENFFLKKTGSTR